VGKGQDRFQGDDIDMLNILEDVDARTSLDENQASSL
jgi:hypothetical protein